jgi:hypothetical protein
MNIKTKHKIGDRFWILEDEKLQERTVDKICATIWLMDGKKRKSIYYWSTEYNERFVTDDSFYETKKQFIDNL